MKQLVLFSLSLVLAFCGCGADSKKMKTSEIKDTIDPNSATEHATFGVLKLARRVQDNDPKAKAKVIELRAIQVNPELDPKLFEKPERATAPPEQLSEK